MPKVVEFWLPDKDYEDLEKFLSKGRANVREVKRAEVLMLLHNQVTAKDIHSLFRIAESTTHRIRKSYLKYGLKEALVDSDRPGAPRKFSATDGA